MQCDYPTRVLKAGTRSKKGKVYNEDVLVRCGYCYPCRLTRLRQWIFRLRQEEKQHTKAYFVTLTYSPATVPISENGFMTLHTPTKVWSEEKKKMITKSSDLQIFFKNLRNTYRYKKYGKWQYDKVPEIKYYAVGEYGSKGESSGFGRPHYHAIIFGADEDNIVESWRLYNQHAGDVYLGEVNEQTIAYTLTYMITKSGIQKKHHRDDRVKEYSIMSKGIGQKYIEDKNVREYYQNNPLNMSILQEDGTRIGLPKYYRDYMYKEKDEEGEDIKVPLFSDKVKSSQAHYVQDVIMPELESKDRRTEQQKRNAKIANFQKIKKSKS